ncbi:hypothetical protein M409DRAFT_27198 [Zasmidium cellare ATCC 36951]|uniref:Uncharacterized protein n=1 Tax=Zasmidium cellare ATCC 36951 TaxID=1080233 RepID=A0A6A6CAU0_ZASCE|nr:uncharacterized protein M409DRAFT_27198 [Zasmidium cellare ATCC 36951]KAF2162576.1 hypothetical protein M409DRAFT_27198 [Zasmidium cellare ATCC 36951]
MASLRSEPLFVQDDEFDDDDDDLRSRRSTMPPRGGTAIEAIDVTEDDDDVQEIPATQATAAPTQPQQPPVQTPQQEPINLEADEGPQRERYYLPIFKKSHYKDEVFNRLRKTYAAIFRRQAGLAMPNSRLKQRLEDIAGTVPSKLIGYVIDRDAKAWVQELRNQKRALHGELQQLETFREALQRPAYQTALGRAVVRDVQAKVDKIEEDLKLRENLVEEMKIFAKMN